jgi:hypothetical protein
MQQVQWSLIPNPTSNLGFRVEDNLNPNANWVFFFTGVYLEDYPKVIEAAVKEVGSGFNAVGANFPGDLDEWDLEEHGPLPADGVELYHHNFGNTIIPRDTFYAVLYAFAERLLERTDRPAAWYEAMRAALAKLRVKMAADAAIG